MKLYTEEQVKKIIFNTKQWSNLSNDYLIATVTPIELPSDEEIENGMSQRLFLSDKHAHFNSGAKAGFKLGAKWMREQILNQNNNQRETLEEWKSKFTHHCAIKPKNK